MGFRIFKKRHKNQILLPFKGLINADVEDDEWLKLAYTSILCRGPDSVGQAFFQEKMKTQSREWAVHTMVTSEEYKGLIERRKTILGKYFESKPKKNNSFDIIKNFQLEVTTHCNMNPPCAMCDRAWNEDPPYHIDVELLTKFNNRLSADAEIALFGQGEPLAHPELFKAVDKLDIPNRQIGFATNGLLLNEKRCQQLVSRGLGWVNISMDAATPKTYKRIRGNDFQLLCSNVKRLAEKRSGKLPFIIINMLIMQTNVQEIAQFSRLANELGADKVQYHPLNPSVSPGKITTAPNGEPFNYSEELIHCGQHSVASRQLKEAENICSEHGIEFLFTGDYETQGLSND